MSKIELENLSVTYLDKKRNEYPVLKSVSGYLERGSINVITGASGSGKTTLLRAIAGQFDFDGTVKFDGKEISSPSAVNKQNVAYIDQQHFLFENKIVYDILAFPLKQQHQKADEIDEKVKKMAVLLGISDLLTRKPGQLSPGQRQKVAFGKALIKNPKVCLFDEPFSNLDEESKTYCLSLLLKVAKEQEMTVIFVSHSEKDADVLGAAIYTLNEDGLVKIRDQIDKEVPNDKLEEKIPIENVKLPINRKQLFKDILRNRYRVVFLAGLLVFLFMLPLIVVSLINDLALVSFFADANNYVNGALTETGQSLYRSIFINYSLFFSGCLLILSVGVAGVARVIRQLCWGEGVQFFNSFGKGIKQNVLRFLVLTVFIDIIFIAATLLFVMIDALWAVIVVCAIGGLALLPIILFCFGYSVIYFNSFPKAFGNSAILTIKHYPVALLLSIVFIIPFLINLLPYGRSIIKTILLCVIAVFIVPLLLLIGGLMLNSIFDKEINEKNHQEIYRKGLF